MVESAPIPSRQAKGGRGVYAFRWLVAHLSEAEAWPKIFHLLEGRPYLADQADHFGGFEVSGADIERYVIPATIRLADWDRFLRYAAVALHLRALAERLAEPDLLRALVRDGRLPLARDAVDRLADPLLRAAARGVLAAACRERGDLFSELLRQIGDDLEEAAPAAAALVAIARSVGAELAPRWPGWAERLAAAAGSAAPLWSAVAANWLDRAETRAPGLWEALGRIGDRDRLLEVAVRLGSVDQGDVEEAASRLGVLPNGDVPTRRLAVARYLDGVVRQRPEDAVAAWERWAEGEPIRWTADLVEACREVLKRLGPARIEDLHARIEDATAQAALRIADLEARPDSRRTTVALAVIDRIPDGPARLHWSLRFLEARSPGPPGEVRGQVEAVAAYLHELRYDAALGDLRRFLDLAAGSHPRQVGRLIEDVVWSPASRPETLLTLASETWREEVASHLLEHAERFAAAVSLTEAEGFELRGELIRRLACRLCRLRGDLGGFETAIDRLLPEEEDELRGSLARQLVEAGRQGEAREVAEGIREPRLRFLTLLRILAPGDLPEGLLSSRSLFAALASAAPLEDERLALSALLRIPFRPRELAQRCVMPVHSGDLRAQGLLRLARHGLAFQHSFYGRRQDRVAAVEVVRSSLVVETDRSLVALTPQIATLGGELGAREAVAELQEAGRHLAAIDTVPWEERAAALEDLLSRVGPALRAGTSRRRSARRAVVVLESLARLPLGQRSDRSLEELRSRWHETLPVLLIAAERLLGGTAEAVLEAVREGIAACGGAGGPAAERVFTLCLAPASERAALAVDALAATLPEPAVLAALAYLLSARAPDRILGLVGRLPDEDCDHLCLRLVRFGWVPSEVGLALAGRIVDPARREEAHLALGPEALSQADWLGSLAAWTAIGPCDPSAPACQGVVERLWSCDPDASRPALARAFGEALRAGGRKRGEASLRFWLHAHLAPVLGTERPRARQLEASAAAALRRSLALVPEVR